MITGGIYGAIMSKISLLIIFLLGAFAEASNKPSTCDEYQIESNITRILYIEFPEVTISGCENYHKKSLFVKKPISVQANITVDDEKKNYTLVMVDPDAPGHVKGKYWLHWIIANIPGEHLKTSVDPSTWTPVIKTYRQPTPPDHEHRYFFFLYSETNSSEMNLEDPGERSKFDLDAFVKSQHLGRRVAVSSFVTRPKE
ncbi:protein D2-like [Oratosquilla oratoria]|uniref:protein D2-like n=1 Tax=Oratosquilla oratoria TaxID=337810 RepID=UPI003F777B2E